MGSNQYTLTEFLEIAIDKLFRYSSLFYHACDRKVSYEFVVATTLT
ncbi:MAG: hypothetical protein V7K89_12285 [Nostoc sp.]